VTWRDRLRALTLWALTWLGWLLVALAIIAGLAEGIAVDAAYYRAITTP